MILPKFKLMQEVRIDGCSALSGYITAVVYRGHYTYEVSWITNGEPKSTVLEEWRLSEVVK